MSQDLSLFHIDQTLAQLLEYQAERMADTADPPGEEERAALECEIQKYMEALPAKVDGVAAYLLMLKSNRAAVRAEIDRLKALEAAAAAREDRLKRYVADILERQPMPKKGPRKLAGATSELRLVGNGGLQPLDIPDEMMIPNEYKDVIITVPWNVWANLDWDKTKASSIKCAPSNSRIREALSEDCPDCEAGYEYDTSECDEHTGSNKIPCSSCGGSGKRGVPGAHLNPRGSHVEVK